MNEPILKRPMFRASQPSAVTADRRIKRSAQFEIRHLLDTKKFLPRLG